MKASNSYSRKLLREFGGNLRKERARLGISQEELAHRAGLDRTYYGGVERGERNISLINIYSIAAALDVHASTLFPVNRHDSTEPTSDVSDPQAQAQY